MIGEEINSKKKSIDNNETDNKKFNPDARIESQNENLENKGFDKYNPDKRLELSKPDKNTLEGKNNIFKEMVGKVNEQMEGKKLYDIVSEPFGKFIDNIEEISMDSLAVAAAYLTSCKMACAELMDDGRLETNNKNDIEAKIKKSLTDFFSLSEFTNKYIQEYGIGPDKIKEAIGEATEFALELGKALFYIRTRIVIGVFQILDNACRAAFSMGLYAMGNSEGAKEVMTESNLKKFKEYLDEVVQPNELEKKIGNIADIVGELGGGLTLAICGAIGILEASVLATIGIIGASLTLGLSEAGKSLEKNIEKSGEYGEKEYISALMTTGATVLFERIMPFVSGIENTYNIVKVSEKVFNATKSNMILGPRLSKSIISGLQATAGMGVFKATDEIKKLVDYGVGITDEFDVKKELLESAAFIIGAGVIGGGISLAADTIVGSKAYKGIVEKITKKEYIANPSKYDLLYQSVVLDDLKKNGMSSKIINNLSMEADGVLRLNTINEKLAGTTNEYGVKYVDKVIEINGVKVRGVFPIFDSKFDCYLKDELIFASDYLQFKECTARLKEAIEKNPELKKQFTEKQLEYIMNGESKIPGYVWHHNEETGLMQLVKSEEHLKSPHFGGKAIWGGGEQFRR
ncbi:MAG: HNH endonuclease [Lachnospiraceae bacterium]|nr:HNH endonuclease [Lachnospiraceae bacterium]